MTYEFCRDCYASIESQHYYVHQFWHAQQKKSMTCPVCSCLVASEEFMAHAQWHES